MVRIFPKTITSLFFAKMNSTLKFKKRGSERCMGVRHTVELQSVDGSTLSYFAGLPLYGWSVDDYEKREMKTSARHRQCVCCPPVTVTQGNLGSRRSPFLL